jgi:hypothetical protein
MWSLNLNAEDASDETATKTASLDRKSDARMAKERICVQNWYSGKIAAKVFALLQKFGGPEQFAEYVDANNAQALAQWNEANRNAPFRFTARPDSSMRVDNAQDREIKLRVYNLIANDPNFDRRKVDQWMIEAFNVDPTWLMTAKPPEPQPEKPKISLSFKGEDLNGSTPQGPVVFAILEENGIQIPAISKTISGLNGIEAERQQAIEEQVKHPGHVKQVETIDKHAADRTGERAGAKPMNAEAIN